MKQLMGVILCGGESRRMGRDKGLLEKDGRRWAQYMADKLFFAGIPVVFSINPPQLSTYTLHLPASRLIVDSPSLFSIAGPLRGLLSVHEQFPGADLLLLACDMIDMDEDTLRQLIDAYTNATSPVAVTGSSAQPASPDFFVYQEGDFAQPFCGIYTSAGLAVVHTSALQERLVDFSLQSLLRKGNTMRMPLQRIAAFRNYNTL